MPRKKEPEGYRFIGSESLIDGLTYALFGQKVALPDDRARELATAHPPALIVPESVWAEAEITDAECAEWPSVRMHGDAPSAFLEKRARLWKLGHEWRTGLGTE